MKVKIRARLQRGRRYGSARGGFGAPDARRSGTDPDTGLKIELPPGYEAQVRSRGGLAYRYGIVVMNSPSTVDPGFRGKLMVILGNQGRAPYPVSVGDRIAQLVIAQYERVEWAEVEKLDETARGEGMLSSTSTGIQFSNAGIQINSSAAAGA